MSRAPYDLDALANGPMVRWSNRNPNVPTPRVVRKSAVPRGHAAAPGSGPAGETCKSCAHIFRNRDCAKVYIKCGLAKHKWTGGGGSDVRAGDAACSAWAAA